MRCVSWTGEFLLKGAVFSLIQSKRPAVMKYLHVDEGTCGRSSAKTDQERWAFGSATLRLLGAQSCCGAANQPSNQANRCCKLAVWFIVLQIRRPPKKDNRTTVCWSVDEPEAHFRFKMHTVMRWLSARCCRRSCRLERQITAKIMVCLKLCSMCLFF